MTAMILLRQARKKAGLSQRALAGQAGVPQSTIGRIEAGLMDPRFGTITKLLRACGYQLESERRLGEGIDRSQIREFLALSPGQRLEAATKAARNIRRLVKAAKRKR